MAEGGEERQEIIIVRRNSGDDDEGHHGGVWKIAFADFMTAMMCFFLVMWLINAANDQTRSALASYFNPVKLTDRNTNRKGLEDVGKGPRGAEAPDDGTQENDGQSTLMREARPGPTDERHSADGADQRRHSDENLFSDPYAVLAEIASDTATRQNVSDAGAGGEQTAGPSSGASGGESYRDPFAPDFWSQQVAEPSQGVEGDPDEARDNPAGTDVADTDPGEHRSASALGPDTGAGESESARREAAYEAVPEVEPLLEAEAPEADAAAERPASEDDAAASDPADPAETLEADEPGRELAAEIGAELAEVFEGESMEEAITVTTGERGVLISVTDNIDRGMFEVGSAVPNRDLVLAMEEIGGVLAARPGAVRVHGHTDGRPFRSENYDNWRLSTARAHAAYYMLVRGGLDEQRIGEVAGFADRELKVADDPYADANRRIEILLEAGS